MKTFGCDSCGMVIGNPYRARMREFVLTFDFADGMPIRTTRRSKVHLCDKCFRGLKQIAYNAEKKWEQEKELSQK